MPREKELFMRLSASKATISAFKLVNELREIVRSYDDASFKVLRKNEDWSYRIAILQHNKMYSDVVNGLPVAIGGIDAGRENPKKPFVANLQATDWRMVCWHINAGEDICPVCDMAIGVGVNYTRPDGSEGVAPSLALSHTLPNALGGSTNIHNVIVECARCNKRRGVKYPKAIDTWLKEIRLKVYVK
jgi:hypothetical protein